MTTNTSNKITLGPVRVKLEELSYYNSEKMCDIVYNIMTLCKCGLSVHIHLGPLHLFQQFSYGLPFMVLFKTQLISDQLLNIRVDGYCRLRLISKQRFSF